MARSVLCFVLVICAFSALTAPVEAKVGMQVSPASVNLDSKPGSSGDQDISVTNTGDDPLDAVVRSEPLSNVPASRSASKWLRVSPAKIHLVPGQQQDIEVSFSLPNGLESGGYYAYITIVTQADGQKDESNQVAVSGGIGVRFIFSVDGDGKIERSASLEHFAPVLEADGRVGFSMDIKNTGNIHLRPSGNAVVAQSGGKKLGSLEFPEALVFPGTEQVIQAQGSLPLPAGKYDATIKLSKDKSDKKPLTQKVTFDTKPDVAMAAASVCENLDKGPTMSFGIKNSGTIGIQPNLTVSVQSESGGMLGGGPLPTVIAWPGQTTSGSVDFPQRLESGKYVLVVEATYGAGQKLEQKTPFQIGGVGGNPVPLCTASATPAA